MMRKLKSYDISIQCDTERTAMLMWLYIRAFDCLIKEPENNFIKINFVANKELVKYKKFAKLLGGVKITIDDERLV